MELKVGDVVQLKSGSPTMTVESVGPNHVKAIWYVDGAVRRDTFPQLALQKVDATKESC